MSGDYSVDLAAAKLVHSKLSEFEERINPIRKRLQNAGRNTLGTRDLDDACDDFQDRWDDALVRLNKAAQQIGGTFAEAMGNYTDTENDVSADMGHAATPTPSAGPSPAGGGK